MQSIFLSFGVSFFFLFIAFLLFRGLSHKNALINLLASAMPSYSQSYQQLPDSTY